MTVKFVIGILLFSNAYSLSIDCPNMNNLARGLGIESQQPAIWTQLQSDCCVVSGVTCSSQRVTQITWSNMNLNGIIDKTAIPSNLQTLDLNTNQLTGPIPTTWPSGLQTLDLSTNQLNGTIPTTFPSGVHFLHLNNNQLTGTIPAVLPSSLQQLDLYVNKLNGSIPSTWPSGLQFLHLNNNQFNGTIPTTWPSVLQQLDLSTNQFYGSIPSTFPNPLQFLHLNNNQLTGSIPTTLPSSLSQFDLYINQLTGPIPSTLPTTVQYLHLNNNQLSGSISSTWPSGIQYITLHDNQLTGSIPNTLPSGLLKIYLNNNKITGSLPNLLPSGLLLMDLGNNQISGSISNTWPGGLQYLHLESNAFTGVFPALPSTLVDLRLGYPGDLTYNQFRGTLVLNQPTHLYINNNMIADLVVYDPSLLTGNCDLSNNPLLGNPHLNNLTMCTENGLYSANSIQSTSKRQTFFSSLVQSRTIGMQSSTTAQSSTMVYSTSLQSSATAQSSTMVFSTSLQSASLVSKTNLQSASSQNDVFNLLRTRHLAISYITSVGMVTSILRPSYISTLSAGKLFINVASNPTENSLVRQFNLFKITLAMLLRIAISILLLTLVATKAPVAREIKKMRKNVEGKNNLNGLL